MATFQIKSTSFLSWWNAQSRKTQQQWLTDRRRDGRDKTDFNYLVAYANQIDLWPGEDGNLDEPPLPYGPN